MKIINCAIVGMGGMGKMYFEILKRYKIRIKGLCDKKYKKINNDFYFNNLEDLLKKNKIDLIVIATTANSRLDIIKLAIKHNVKKIVIEKPLATSLYEGKKIMKLIKKNNIYCTINHHSRYQHHLEKIKDIIKKNHFGEISSINYIGGDLGFAMNGVHIFEIFRFITDELVTEVSAKLEKKKNNPRGNNFEDVSGILIGKTKNNKRLFIDISKDQGHGKTLLISCKNGFLFLDLFTGNLYFNVRKKKYKDYPNFKYHLPSKNKKINLTITDTKQSTDYLIKNFLMKKNIVNPKVGFDALKILIAAYKSSDQDGKVVKINNLKSTKKFKWA